MNLPIDEMLLELRAALEAFEAEVCPRTLDAVFKETGRIADYCENEWVALDGD